MTDEQINVAIAEACGWKHDANWVMPWSYPMSDSTTGRAFNVPSYATDLNAMHEAEKTLDMTGDGVNDPTCLRFTYSHFLYSIVEDKCQPFRATARQRAEAFLRTVGKWTD